MKDKLISRFVIGTFVTLYLLVSIISTIHVIDFFEMSNPYWLAVTLAIGFEIGAAASLASLIILDKMNKTVVWALFLAITLMQMQGNMYYAFINLNDYNAWSELFNLIEEDPLYQKRILAFVSGAILPLIALGFIKSLVDYIKPKEENEIISEGQLSDIGLEMPEKEPSQDYFEDKIEDMRDVVDAYDSLQNEIENHVVEQPTKEKREQILTDMMSRDEELGLYDDWDETLLDGLEDEEWDEDHALDMVLNDMASDFTEADVETMIDAIADSDEPNEELKAEVDAYKNNPTSVGAIVQKMNTPHLPQDEDALFREANRMKAEEDKKAFIKSNQNDSKTTN